MERSILCVSLLSAWRRKAQCHTASSPSSFYKDVSSEGSATSWSGSRRRAACSGGGSGGSTGMGVELADFFDSHALMAKNFNHAVRNTSTPAVNPTGL